MKYLLTFTFILFTCFFIRMGSLAKCASDKGLLLEKPKVDFSSDKTIYYREETKLISEVSPSFILYPVIADIGATVSIPVYKPMVALSLARNKNGKVTKEAGGDINTITIELPVNDDDILRQYVQGASDRKAFVNMEPWENHESGNDAGYEEQVSSNYLHKVIIGNDNLLSAYQRGELNQGDIAIYGSNNYLNIDQEGTGNRAETETILDDNLIQINQYGNWNFSRVLQSGFNNNVFIYQNSSN